MIDLQEVLDIHQTLIETFGGSHGVRDQGLLESALERPFSGFGAMEFYKTLEEKASAIFESIVKNHPFIDGNKRTGYVLMRLILMEFGKDINASEDEKYTFVIEAATGEMNFVDILKWINTKIVIR